MKSFYTFLKSLVLITCVFMAAGAQKSWAVTGTATIKKTITSPDDVTITSLTGGVTKVEFNAVDNNGGSWAITLAYLANYTLNTNNTLFYYTGKNPDTQASVDNGKTKVASSQSIDIHDTTVSTDDDNEYFHITGNIKLNTTSTSNKSGYAYLDLDLEYNVGGTGDTGGSTTPTDIFADGYTFTSFEKDREEKDIVPYYTKEDNEWTIIMQDANSNKITLTYPGENFAGEKSLDNGASMTLKIGETTYTKYSNEHRDGDFLTGLGFTVSGNPTEGKFSVTNGSFTMNDEKVKFSYNADESIKTIQKAFEFTDAATYKFAFIPGGWKLDITEGDNTAHFQDVNAYTDGDKTGFDKATFSDGATTYNLTLGAESFHTEISNGKVNFNEIQNVSLEGFAGSSLAAAAKSLSLPAPNAVEASHNGETWTIALKNNGYTLATVGVAKGNTGKFSLEGLSACTYDSNCFDDLFSNSDIEVYGDITSQNCDVTITGAFDNGDEFNMKYLHLQKTDVVAHNLAPVVAGGYWTWDIEDVANPVHIFIPENAYFAGEYRNADVRDNNYNNFAYATITVAGKLLNHTLKGYGYLANGNCINFRTDYYDTNKDDVTISTVGYATYYNKDKAVTLPTGVEGYVAYIADGALHFEKAYAEGETVPANTAIVVKGNANTYNLNYTTGGTDQSNDLVGVPFEAPFEGITASQMAEGKSNYKFYALSLDAENPTVNSVGFYWLADGGAAFNLEGGKAYLPVMDGSIAEARGFAFNDVLGISDIKAEKEAGVMYNVYGQRVKEAKGLVVREGKMMFVK